MVLHFTYTRPLITQKFIKPMVILNPLRISYQRTGNSSSNSKVEGHFWSFWQFHFKFFSGLVQVIYSNGLTGQFIPKVSIHLVNFDYPLLDCFMITFSTHHKIEKNFDILVNSDLIHIKRLTYDHLQFAVHLGSRTRICLGRLRN